MSMTGCHKSWGKYIVTGGGKALAVVKFVNAGSPMNNIFDYVTRREATESKLISGVNCSPESTLDGRVDLHLTM